MIKDMALAVGNFLIIGKSPGPKENTRNAYDLALVSAGLPASTREPAIEMFKRAWLFTYEYIEVLKGIEREIFDDVGLIGGAAVPTLADIEFLSTADAKRVFDITFALYQVEHINKDIMDEMVRWSAELGVAA